MHQKDSIHVPHTTNYSYTNFNLCKWKYHISVCKGNAFSFSLQIFRDKTFELNNI